MSGIIGGLIGACHECLDAIGRGVAYVSFGSRSLKADLSYAVIGGATAGAIIGPLLAYLNSWEHWIVSSIMGGCLGALLGALIQGLDEGIEAFLNWFSK